MTSFLSYAHGQQVIEDLVLLLERALVWIRISNCHNYGTQSPNCITTVVVHLRVNEWEAQDDSEEFFPAKGVSKLFLKILLTSFIIVKYTKTMQPMLAASSDKSIGPPPTGKFESNYIAIIHTI